MSKRVRIRYKKGKEIAFLSHLDIWRAFSRLVRRAEIPIEFSQGFHPRPMISMGPALPVGASGEEELLDIFLEREPDSDLLSRLKACSPPGLEIKETWFVEEKDKALTAFPFLSLWYLSGTWEKVPEEDFLKALLQREELFTLRSTPKVVKQINLKKYLRALRARRGFLEVELYSSPLGGARLEEVLRLLEEGGYKFCLEAISRRKLIPLE
ncbi:MAG: TIGR03936 family radical SAM-associated protein [Caldiserica bacterium]|jgi:radical SAM-linked protein|nr:TIGR03936 family radical SAM-associated protein [Caldisericota bacterium]